MRKLQERLAETEAQMSKILAAMQMVQSRVADMPDPEPSHASQDTVSKQDSSNNQGRETGDSEEKVRHVGEHWDKKPLCLG